MLRAVASGGDQTVTNLDVASGGSIDIYNTTPISSTDYERLRADWSSNVARLWTQNDGTGTGRALRVGAGTTDGTTAPQTYTAWQAAATPFITNFIPSTSATGALQEFASSGNLAASSGTQTAVAISPTYAQTSTAAGIALLVNPSGTFGSGGGKLLSAQLASSEVFYVNTAGSLVTGGTVVSTLGYSWGASIGVSDLSLVRDAADTLAQRNGTNAQIFRVYNTYTDASNNEWGGINWNSSVMYFGTVANGTGTVRNLVLVRGAATCLTLTSSAMIALPAGTTAKSQINFASSTAPSAPADGDLWFDGTNLKLQVSGTTYTITKT